MDRLSAADIKRTLADKERVEARALLGDLLDRELAALRAEAGIERKPACSRQGLLDQIRASFEARNLDLEALALLELHYFSPVQLTMREIAGRVGVDERTLRRRQQRGYRYLAKRYSDTLEVAEAKKAASRLSRERRHNLPMPEGSFVGRESDLITLERLLQVNPVVVLLGEAGIGKSRLAIELGLQMAETLADGAWILPLEHIDSPDLILPALSTILGADGGEPSPGEDPVKWLAEREGLLILDRCERLTSACARLISRVVAEAPRVRIVATSRLPIGNHRDTTWPLTPLTVPPPGPCDQESLGKHAAARLFLDRLTTAAPHFKLDIRRCEQVADLVRRLDGLPLAIELAAARAALLPLETVITRLTRGIAQAASGQRDEHSTPDSVRQAIEIGLTDLSLEEHRLLARLAIFAGGFDLESVQAVCADGDDSPGSKVDRNRVLQQLSRLVRRSLVVSLGLGIGRRHRLLEALRAYAMDMLLRSGEFDAVGRRHAEHFARWIELADAKLSGEEVGACMYRLAAEHDNLQAAFTWALEADPPLALRIACGMATYRIMTGQLTAGRHQIERAMSACEMNAGALDLELRIEALSSAGMMARQQCENDIARPLLERALEGARELGEPILLSSTLRRLGNVVEEIGERDTATTLYVEAAENSRAHDDLRGLVGALNNLGILADHEGRSADAVGLLEEAMTIVTRLSAPWMEGVVRGNLANALLDSGRIEDARRAYHASLDLSRGLGDRFGMASLLASLANADRAAGYPDQAWADLEEALPLLDDVADRQKAAEWFDTAAQLLADQALAEPAASALGAAEGLRERWSIEVLPKNLAIQREFEASVDAVLGPKQARALKARARSQRWQAVAEDLLQRAHRKEAGASPGW